MVECDVTVKKWGNSLGLVLPKELASKNNIKPNQKVHILIANQDNTAKKMFGMFKGKLKKSSQEMKDEIRKELHAMG